MPDHSHLVIFITANNAEEAQHIAGILLEQRKAACVNIINGVKSGFWWQGKLEDAEESLLIVKTRASLLPEVTKLVRENHSNTVPEIIALPIVGGHRDYLDWIDREVN